MGRRVVYTEAEVRRWLTELQAADAAERDRR